MRARAPADTSHDKLAQRLVDMLCLLNTGQRLVPRELAEHFNVTLRTIQRDIARLGTLGLDRVDGGYQLKSEHRFGKATMPEVEQFARLAGVDGLFPALRQALAQAGQKPLQEALLVKGPAYEDIASHRREFEQLKGAIVERHRVSFRLKGGAAAKVYYDVEPYRLLNQKGVWYLVARHLGRTKTFSLTKISGLLVMADRFEHDPVVSKRLEEDDGIWFQEVSRDVILEVAAVVAHYFRRRKLIANQEIVEDRQDGSLLLKARIGHDNQVLPIVRYWIPHVRIIEPVGMQVALEQALLDYVYGSASTNSGRSLAPSNAPS